MLFPLKFFTSSIWDESVWAGPYSKRYSCETNIQPQELRHCFNKEKPELPNREDLVRKPKK